MQAGLTTIQVGDVKVLVRLTWRQYKELTARVSAWDETATNAADEIERELVPLVQRIEGLTDESGAPIERLTEDNIGDLSPGFLMTLFRKVLDVGEEVPAQPAGRGRRSA